jgi:hypothetical protein
MPLYQQLSQTLVFSAQSSQTAAIVTDYENFNVFIGDLYISSSSAPFNGVATLTFYSDADMADEHIVWIADLQLSYNSLSFLAPSGNSYINLNSAAGFAPDNLINIFADSTPNPAERRRIYNISNNVLTLIDPLVNNHASGAAVANCAEFGGLTIEDMSYLSDGGGKIYCSVSFNMNVSLTLTLEVNGASMVETEGVTTLNGLSGALSLIAGSGITVTPSGSGITIASTGGSGSVTSVSVDSANGLAGSVTNPTTTPAITLSTTVTGILYGNGTAITAAISSNFPTLNQNTTGTASNITATSNSTLTTLSSLSLPYSQVTGAPTALVFSDSLVNSSGTVTLINDSATPAASSYYGTNGSSVLGYHTLPVSGINQLTGDVIAGPGTGSQVASLVATSNSTLVTLSALSLPYSQITGTPAIGANVSLSNLTSTAVNVPINMRANSLIGDTVAGNLAAFGAAGNLTLQSNSNGSLGSAPGYIQAVDGSAWVMGSPNAIAAANTNGPWGAVTIALDVAGGSEFFNNALWIFGYGANPDLVFGSTGGTVASPTYVLDGNALGFFGFADWNGTTPADRQLMSMGALNC